MPREGRPNTEQFKTLQNTTAHPCQQDEAFNKSFIHLAFLKDTKYETVF